MTSHLSLIIATRVTPYNAPEVQSRCEAEIALARANGSRLDEEPMRGKWWQCQRVKHVAVNEVPGMRLVDLLEAFGIGVGSR